MKIKKILAGALAAVVAAESLSISAFAETDVSGDFEYEVLDDGTVSITDYFGEGGAVEIPAEIDGKSVTLIGTSAFMLCSSLTEIVIPDSVTWIQTAAFNGCSSLTEIVIPDSVTDIGSYAFEGCSSLTKIVIPDSVTWMGTSVFSGCSSLTEIVIPDSVTVINVGDFSSCTSLTEIVIPDSVTYIEEDGGEPFSGCSDDLTIYGYTGSYAETYAKLKEINFVALDKEPSETEPEETTTTTTSTQPEATTPTPAEELITEDKENGVQIYAAYGVLPSDVKLNVKTDGENQTDTSAAFDITLTDSNGSTVKIDGNVTVKIAVPEELKGADKYYVYYQAEDGTLTDMKAAYADGYVTFTTPHFSTYILSTTDLTDAGVEGNTSTPTQPTTTEPTATEPAATTTAPAATTAAPTTSATTTATTTSATTTATTTSATTTAPTTSATTNEDTIPNTGAVILFIPALAAAAAVIISKKRK